MQNLDDLYILQRAHDDAVNNANSAAVTIAELVADNKEITDEDIKRYKIARLGVESTRRDLEYCMSIALSGIIDR